VRAAATALKAPNPSAAPRVDEAVIRAAPNSVFDKPPASDAAPSNTAPQISSLRRPTISASRSPRSSRPALARR
jgi:hypothetical protein